MTRLSKLVSPPSAQCSMWCQSTNPVLVQPGQQQPLSLARNARRIGDGIVLDRRPIERGSPFFSSFMVTMELSQANRLDVSAVDLPLGVRRPREFLCRSLETVAEGVVSTTRNQTFPDVDPVSGDFGFRSTTTRSTSRQFLCRVGSMVLGAPLRSGCVG